MFETEIKLPRVILCAVDTGEYNAEASMNELAELARTAGAEVAARVVQKRPVIDNATCIGSGRLAELKELCQKENAERAEGILIKYLILIGALFSGKAVKTVAGSVLYAVLYGQLSALLSSKVIFLMSIHSVDNISALFAVIADLMRYLSVERLCALKSQRTVYKIVLVINNNKQFHICSSNSEIRCGGSFRAVIIIHKSLSLRGEIICSDIPVSL